MTQPIDPKPPLQLLGLAGSLAATYYGLSKSGGAFLLLAAGGAAGSVYFLSKLADFALSPPAGPAPPGTDTSTTDDATGG